MKRICSFFKMNDNMHLKYQLHLEPTDAAPVVDCGFKDIKKKKRDI